MATENGNVNAQLMIATNAVTYFSGFVGGLRGEEIFKLELGPTERHHKSSVNHRRLPHVTLGLKGRVKGESAYRCHLLPLVLVTASRLRVGDWTD